MNLIFLSPISEGFIPVEKTEGDTTLKSMTAHMTKAEKIRYMDSVKIHRHRIIGNSHLLISCMMKISQKLFTTASKNKAEIAN
jgi:hypothetical protein